MASWMPWAATAVAEEAIKRVGVVGREFYAVVGTLLVTHGCERGTLAGAT